MDIINDSIEIFDIEALASSGQKVPEGKRPHAKYRIRIDKKNFVVEKSEISGKELLELSGHNPPGDYLIMLIMHGGRPEQIELNQVVDLSRPGMERFITEPKKINEG